MAAVAASSTIRLGKMIGSADWLKFKSAVLVTSLTEKWEFIFSNDRNGKVKCGVDGLENTAAQFPVFS